ncbi:FemAB family protein [Flavobacterium sp.]|uniref:FemAB family protein n=1 Tax=Flavobacterium sp. TaxID=239 RepID=UPI003D10EF57
MIKVIKYNVSYFKVWNEFITDSKNATFLFHRDFMEYHQDRFDDYSLLAFEGEKLVAVLPANRVEDEVYSHQGLTYGGFYFAPKLKIIEIETILSSIFQFLKKEKIKRLVVKNILPFYEVEAQGVSFLLMNRFKAQLIKREMNLMIDYKMPLKISKSKLKHFRKIAKLGLEIRQDNDCTPFWNLVLLPRLEQKYGTKPVHSLEEINALMYTFPTNIFQYSVYFNDEIIAGLTLFISKYGIKSQYGATTALGVKYRALDFLFINLIENFKNQGFSFFDMGTVSEDNEKGYNEGLLQQKLELGCSIFNQDRLLLNLNELKDLN